MFEDIFLINSATLIYLKLYSPFDRLSYDWYTWAEQMISCKLGSKNIQFWKLRNTSYPIKNYNWREIKSLNQPLIPNHYLKCHTYGSIFPPSMDLHFRTQSEINLISDISQWNISSNPVHYNFLICISCVFNHQSKLYSYDSSS